MLDKFLAKQFRCLNIICCQTKHVLILPIPQGSVEGEQAKPHLCLFLQGVYLHILQTLPEDLTSNFSTHLGPDCGSPQRTKKNVDIFFTLSFWLCSDKMNISLEGAYSHIWCPRLCSCCLKDGFPKLHPCLTLF